jgi:hypothetical protein
MLNRLTVTQQILKQLPDSDRSDFDQALREWWLNFRDGGGLRLSNLGEHIFTSLEIERYDHNIVNITAGLLLLLDQKLTCPYYIKTGKKPVLTLFGSKEAMTLKLYGDLNRFLTVMPKRV